MLGDALAVAGQNFHRDAGPAQRGEGRSRALLRRIEEAGQSREHELGFIAHHRVRMVDGHAAPGDAQRAKTAVAKLVAQLLNAVPSRAVEGQRRVARAVFVAGREAKYVFRGAFDDQQPRTRAFYQHRDAPALEVEWDFVHLAPPRAIDFLVLEDRFVEGAAQPRLESAV